ncbi:MAG: LuxR C-terminal-related transcriptional regulator [Pseudomonadota bacterium]
MDDKVLALAERLSNLDSTDHIWTAVCEGLGEMGFAEVSWGYVDPDASPPIGVPTRSTLPISLWEHYYRERFYKQDPIIAHIRVSDEPFVDHFGWRDISALPPRIRQLAELLSENCLPARFATGERALGRTKVAILSLAAEFDPDDWLEHVNRHIVPFTLASRMCAAYMASAEPPALEQSLSAREVECLTLLAQGNRNDRISEILGLHRATVEMHTANARRKLGARTREEAVAKAVAAGAIKV